jgi:hypothetical protein
VLDLTSLTVEEFRQLVPPFAAAFQAHMADGRLDGKPRTARRYTTDTNCPLPTLEDRLLCIRIYLKTYPLQVVQGRLFGMGQSQAPQWRHALWVVLRATRRTLGDAPTRSCRPWRSASAWPRPTRGRWSSRQRGRRRLICPQWQRYRCPPPPCWPRWHRTAHRAPPGSN